METRKDSVVYMIGNAHLDPVWLWRWQEGYAEVKATFRSALDRMKEFPDFVFTCAGAAYYKWVEENEPEMFKEIVQRVKEGRWVVVGGWWIQPDCNIPSGESLARHSLYSQRYFMKSFGALAKVGYNVDSFGHNGMLPQILKKSGMDYYVFMRPGDHEKKLPGNLFWWESEDGSKVMTFKIPFSYSDWLPEGGEPVEGKIKGVLKLSDEQGIDFMNFYGVGNHGGGPTIANLLKIQELKMIYGEEKIKLSSPEEYFRDMEKQELKLPLVKDDLQHHASGCYSTHNETKMNNRKSEQRLISAEKYASLAQILTGMPYPDRKIQDAWENVLFNQFHDIMGGCSIKEAYDDAREGYGETLHLAAEVANSSLQRISWSIDTSIDERPYLSKDSDWVLWEVDNKGIPVVVFNPLSWEVEVPVEVNKQVSGVTDEGGMPQLTQKVRASRTNGKDKWNTLFMAKVPAMGYRVYWIFRDKSFSFQDNADDLKIEGPTMENKWLRIEFDEHTGYIKRMLDKRNNFDAVKGKAAVPVIIEDFNSDTWAHGIFEFRDEIGRFSDAEISIIEEGPLRVTMRVKSFYNNSVLQQDFTLYSCKEDVDVKVKVDWREKHKILKLSFPVNVEDPEAVYEIPFGFIKRPVNGEEEPGQRWIDVTGAVPGKDDMVYGISILNDSKHSFDVKDNDMRMTVLRSSIFADHYGERDELCEFMEQGIHNFKYSLVPHSGDWKSAGIVKKSAEFNTTFERIVETYHKGALQQRYEGIMVSSQNVVAEVLKRAEDGEAFILRCYELNGEAAETDIEIPSLNKKWHATFGKCEIKTFRISLNPFEAVTEVNLIEM